MESFKDHKRLTICCQQKGSTLSSVILHQKPRLGRMHGPSWDQNLLMVNSRLMSNMSSKALKAQSQMHNLTFSPMVHSFTGVLDNDYYLSLWLMHLSQNSIMWWCWTLHAAETKEISCQNMQSVLTRGEKAA
jgi:hypothetical protein